MRLHCRRRPQFSAWIEGTWGDFKTRSGHVAYVMTNARLGSQGVDNERRLTGQLRPVREVLNVRDMNFDELLQRDLDDHRVVTELVPYLLRDPDQGPTFFPPILAVLLPYQGMEQTNFAAPQEDDIQDENGLPFHRQTFGEGFQVLRLTQGEGQEPSDIRLCRVGWNAERAKLVVIDGQHRAMALLAIHRTMNGTWEDDVRGARYRHFYEGPVEAVLARHEAERLEMVHVPVTVCWFPDLVGEAGPPHRAARRLFVDVNREARPPSPDRLVLLSDDDLLNILTRSILNELRKRDEDPPLYALEYDSPSTGGRPGRWSALLSLQSTRNLLRRTVFGPKKYVTNVTTQMRGRTSTADEDAFMREQLRVRDLFTHDLGGVGGGRREALGRVTFPKGAVQPLVEEFEQGWGLAILTVLGDLTPFKIHYEALRALDDAWTPADPATVDALAWEGIFEGVGMFWTLRESYEHWRSSAAVGDRTNKPDVVQAWERTLEKEKQFRRLRSLGLLGSGEPADIALTDSVYDVFQTQACQVSLGLTLATLAARIGIDGRRAPELAGRFVASLNTSMDVTTPSGAIRRIMLSQSVDSSLNRIAEMNTTRAVEFRYFWLELLCDKAVLDEFVGPYDALSAGDLESIRDRARMRYAQQLIDERVRSLRRLERKSRDQLLGRATLEVLSFLQENPWLNGSTSQPLNYKSGAHLRTWRLARMMRRTATRWSQVQKVLSPKMAA